MLFKRTNKVVIIALLRYLVFIAYLVLSAISSELRPRTTVDANSFTYMFNEAQPFGVYSSFPLILALSIFPIVGSLAPIFIKNNNGITNVLQQSGYAKFLRKAGWQTFFLGMSFSPLSEIFEIILINWDYAPIVLTSNSFYLGQFFNTSSENSLVQLLTYMVTSSIGWGIFSVFIFAYGLYTEKDPLFMVPGAVLGLILLLLPVLYGMMNYLLYTVANVTEISTLIAPGMISLADQEVPGGIMVIWIINAILFASIAWTSMMTWQKKQL